MNPEQDFQFLADGLAAFYAMRSEGACCLGALWLRLENTLLGDLPRPRHSRPRHSVSRGTGPIRRLRRWWKVSTCTAARLPFARDRIKTGPDLVLAINSARLREPSVARDPRLHLANLLQELPGSGCGRLPKDEIAQAGIILIFDPGFESTYGGDADSLAAAGIYVLDVGLLLFLARHDLPGAVWQYLRYRSQLKSFSFTAGLMLVLLSRTYDRLLGEKAQTAYFLTSNSFATEILRLCLMRSEREHRILEILHGIPSQEVTRYFTRLDQLSGPRMRFIPQIPGLALPSNYRRWSPAAPSLAINTYVNRYFAALPKELAPAEFIFQEWAKLPSVTAKNRITLAFVGANSLDEDFEGSTAFAVEKALIGFVREWLTAAHLPFLLVYAPHPRHNHKRLSQDPLFSQPGIVLHPSTIFTWIIADCCISLFSSGLFEAAYLGLPTFSPLSPQDDLFDPGLLELIHHPRDSSLPQLFESLETMLRAIPACAGVDVLVRARVRIKLLVAAS